MRAEEYRLTPDRMKILMDNIRQGVPFKYAVRVAGIGEMTFHRYKAKSKQIHERLLLEGRAPKTKAERWHMAFKDELDRAEAAAVARNVGLINIAASTNWQAAAWWLERTFPEFYARRTIETNERSVERLSVVKDDDIDLSGCSVDELKIIERVLSRKKVAEISETPED